MLEVVETVSTIATSAPAVWSAGTLGLMRTVCGSHASSPVRRLAGTVPAGRSVASVDVAVGVEVGDVSSAASPPVRARTRNQATSTTPSTPDTRTMRRRR